MSKLKLALKRKIIFDPVLGFTFYLQVGGTEIETYQWIQSKLGWKIPDQLGANTGSFGVNSNNNFVGVLWLSNKCGGSTVVHEVAHAAIHVCRALDMNPLTCEEFFTSYTGWLFRQVNLFMQRK